MGSHLDAIPFPSQKEYVMIVASSNQLASSFSGLWGRFVAVSLVLQRCNRHLDADKRMPACQRMTTADDRTG